MHRSHVRRRLGLFAVVAVLAVVFVGSEALAAVPGQLLFARTIGTSTSEAGAWSVAAGPGGATAVAGWKIVAPTGQVPMVAKYTAAGQRKWLRTYTAAGKGYAESVAFDSYGNVYVAATVNTNTPGGDSHIVLLKYATDGTFRWARTYDGPGGSDDAIAVAVDKVGNIVVLGSSRGSATLNGLVVIKYSRLGTELWAAPTRFDPDPADPNAGSYYGDELAFDSTGNIYIAGSADYKVSDQWVESLMVRKMNGADGAKGWGWLYEARHNTDSYAEAITVRGTSVVVVGSTYGGSGAENDGLIVKFDLAGNEKYWKEWGAGNSTGEWFGDVALDASGNVFVTGDQWLDTPTGYDKTVTMKLNPSLSKVVWKATYLPTTRDAEGWYLARDSLGNVYVSGVVDNRSGDTDVLTMKYSAAGARKWLRVWSAGGPDDDEPNGLVLGTSGGVYVGGQVTGKGDIYQSVLLKYQR